MQARAAGGVFELGFFPWVNDVYSAECDQSAFVKTAQNEFFLAWVAVDVAHRKDVVHAGGEFFCGY